MQIDIDFEVFKALTALRESESDSYNAVIRRLLTLPDMSVSTLDLNGNEAPQAFVDDIARLLNPPPTRRKGLFGSGKRLPGVDVEAQQQVIGSRYLGRLSGAWFSNIHFPEGTKFRANYKGKMYQAAIKGNQWVDADGVVRTSPSDAAGAISNTNVNGWRFWHAQLPGDPSWRRLDEFKG